jgi:hypothetical protein
VACAVHRKARGGSAGHRRIRKRASRVVFATAMKFTKLVHQDEFRQPYELVVRESPAARYVAHQQLVNRTQKIAGHPSRLWQSVGCRAVVHHARQSDEVASADRPR